MSEILPDFVSIAHPTAIVGKGGISRAASDAIAKARCPYFTLPGGTAALSASRITMARGPYWSDLGSAESVWEFEVRSFGPLVVSVDLEGRNMHDRIIAAARGRAERLFPRGIISGK
jgi:fumarate hydratase subunit beta